MNYFIILLLIATFCPSTKATPIGSSCSFSSDSTLETYSQSLCGTADLEKLTCVDGKCLGTLSNNMCGTESSLCAPGLFCHSLYNICASCPENCKFCTDSSTCTQCYSNYFLNAFGNCSRGPDHCSDPASGIECKSEGCESGYYYVGGKSSSSCSPGPLNCYKATSATACLQCKSGFYWDSTASACASVSQNCLTATSASSCTSCASSYWLDNLSQAEKVLCSGPVANCQVVRKPGYCSACKEGYFLSQDSMVSSSCAQISVSHCKRSAVSSSVCTTCSDYYILWKECKKALANCKIAASETACSACDEGYTVDSIKKTCVFCGVGIKQCIAENLIVRNRQGCRTGWYMSTASLVCVYCGSSLVVSCSRKTHTTAFSLAAAKCEAGYYKTASGKCASCAILNTGSSATQASYASCTVDDSNNIASVTCALNAYLSGRYCYPCSTYALTCNSTTDLTCQPGYGVKDNICSACSTGTAECTFISGVEQGTTKCLSGIDGAQNYYFYTDNPTCFPCSSTSARTCGLKGSAAAVTCDTDTGYGWSTIGKGCVYCNVKEGAPATCQFNQGDTSLKDVTCQEGYAKYYYAGSYSCYSCTQPSITGYDSNAASCTSNNVNSVNIASCQAHYCLMGYPLSASKWCIGAYGVAKGACTTEDSVYLKVTACADDYAYASGYTTAATACYSAEGCAAGGCTTTNGNSITYNACKAGYASSSTSVPCTACLKIAASISSSPENADRWNTCKYDAPKARYVVLSCNKDGQGNYYAPSSISGDTDCNKCSYVTGNPHQARECTINGKLSDSDTACASGYVRNSDLTSCISKPGYKNYPFLRDMVCSTGYVLNSNTLQCVQCAANSGVSPATCEFISSTGLTVPTSCNSGSEFYTQGKYCVSCGSHAASCSLASNTATVDKIISCETGYALKITASGYYSCEPCDTGVSSCEYYTVNSCSGAFYVDTNVCTHCIDARAASCSGDGRISISCISGYSIFSSYCKLCNTGYPYQNVDQCKFSSDGYVSEIISCMTSFYTGPSSLSDKTITCFPCLSGSMSTDSKIATCSYNPTSPSYPKIQSCIAGSFLSTNCFPAVPHCKSPISPGACSISGCETGYYCKDGLCASCGFGASGCTYSSTSGQVRITGCLRGYYFDSQINSCRMSALGCANWLNATYCYTADSGYYIDDGIPQSCGILVSSCKIDKSILKITSCQAGAYLTQQSLPTCLPCSEGCQKCSNASSCSSCLEGYYLVGKSCVAVEDPNCLTVTQTATCAQCDINYYLNSTTEACQSCEIANCIHCSSDRLCLACATGYYLSAGSCIVCPFNILTNCVSCSSPITCNQ